MHTRPPSGHSGDEALLGNQNTETHNLKASVVWQLPRLPSSGNTLIKAVGLIANDWQISGIWTGTSGSAYTVGQSYQTGSANVSLNGSPDFAPRIRIVGDPGQGCGSPRRPGSAAGCGRIRLASER